MSHEFGPKTCDYCFAVIEGRVGNYCDAWCEEAHCSELGVREAEEDDPRDYKELDEPEPPNP